MPTESLTNRQWLPGELLGGLKCRSPGWFLDMKHLKTSSHSTWQKLGRRLREQGYTAINYDHKAWSNLCHRLLYTNTMPLFINMHTLCYMPWVVCNMWNWMEHRMEHGLEHGLDVNVITKWALIKIYDRGVRWLMAGYGKNICTLAGPDSHMHSESLRLYRTSHMCYILYKFSYSCYRHKCPPWTDHDNTSFQ